MRLKLTLAYDGTGFRGWARQPGERTVEGVLREALDARLRDRSASSRSPGAPTPACTRSRTSSRSRSRGGPPAERAAEALNAVLPADVAVVARRGGAAGLPRPLFGALALVPLPHLAPARALAVRGRTARSGTRARSTSQRLQASAAMLVGEHDFRAFTPTETQHKVFVRMVEDARWHDRGDAVELEITADSFLRHMVRTLVGTMLEREPDRARRAAAGRAALGRRLDRAAVRASTSSRVGYSNGQHRRLAGAVATIGRVRFPVVLFDLDGTVVDSGGSSSPRCGTRRAPCSGARSPTRS